MSNLHAVAIILTVATLVFVSVIYASNWLGKHVDAVLTGVVEGVQVSARQRMLKLFIMYLSQLGATVGITLIVAFGYTLIANSVSDTGVRTLAYLCAGLAAFASLQWVVLGAWYLVHCIVALRQAEAD
jgi:hypothetical protein